MLALNSIGEGKCCPRLSATCAWKLCSWGDLPVPCPMLDSSRRLACSPHTTVGQAAGCPATPSHLQAQVRQKSAPTFLQRDCQPRNETRTNPTTYHSSVQVFQWPWGAQKTPWVSPPCTPPLPSHGNPYYHHSMGITRWTRARENSSVTFIKNTVPLFPLDPTSYLLTGVKYYYSATPSRQVFLSA